MRRLKHPSHLAGLLLASILLVLVLMAAAIGLLVTLIWTRNLDAELAGDRILEIQREHEHRQIPIE